MESDVTPDGSDVDGSAALRVDLSTLLRDDARLQLDSSNRGDNKHPHAHNPFQPLSPASVANVRAAPSSSAAGYRTESLRLFVGTWNMYGRSAPDDGSLSAFIPPAGDFDCYAIGTEECGASIEASIFFPSKEQWEEQLHQHLGVREFHLLGAATCGATHLALYVRQALVPLVHDVDTASVTTGFANLIPNKAGVAVGFSLGKTSFLFVNSHFAAEQNAVRARNNDFHRINECMSLACVGNGRADARAISDRFDRVFWSGDLNYRVQTTRKMADHVLAKEFHEVMLANDQLHMEHSAGRVFAGFVEEKIDFPPTYKYDPDTDRYDTSRKARIPSWTDRILYKPCAGGEIVCDQYTSVQSIRTSDHKPVRASFHVNFEVKNEVIESVVAVDDLPSLASTSQCGCFGV